MDNTLPTGPLNEPASRCFFPSLLHRNCTAPEEAQRHSVSFKLDLGRMQAWREQGGSPLGLLELAWGLVLRAYTASDSVCYGLAGQIDGRDYVLGLRRDMNLGPEASLRKLLEHLKDYRTGSRDGASLQTPKDLYKYCDTAISWRHQKVASCAGVNLETEKVCCPVPYPYHIMDAQWMLY